MSTVFEKARGGAAFNKNDRYSEHLAGGNGVLFVKWFSADDAEWAARIEELKSFRSLQDNWDGDESVAPPGELVDGAVALAQSLRMRNMEAPDRVVVGVNGTIFFEWHSPLGYREIEVYSPIGAEQRWVQNGVDDAVVTSLRWDT